jgi:hypothetical protein
MTGIGSSPILLLALSDLAAVRAVTGAINANLPKTGPLGTIPPSANASGPRLKNHLEPAAEYLPRRHIEPTPTYEARKVYHVTPLTEQALPPFIPPAEPIGCSKSIYAIKPVWATLPPVEHERVIIRPKVFVQNVDVISKGTLLDMFV